MVEYVKGNLLESDCDYICHQVNCQGVMRSGIARQIREKWPDVYDEYKKVCSKFVRTYTDPVEHMLGHIQFCCTDSGQVVVNIFSQADYGYDGDRYTSYDAFSNALTELKGMIPKGNTIGFPKNIGCGLGGGDWRIISNMIETILGDTHNVYIYEYDPKEDK